MAEAYCWKLFLNTRIWWWGGIHQTVAPGNTKALHATARASVSTTTQRSNPLFGEVHVIDDTTTYELNSYFPTSQWKTKHRYFLPSSLVWRITQTRPV